jgi:hypothetical protein
MDLFRRFHFWFSLLFELNVEKEEGRADALFSLYLFWLYCYWRGVFLSSSSHLLLPDELPIAFSSSFTKSRQLEREIQRNTCCCWPAFVIVRHAISAYPWKWRRRFAI